MYQNCPLTVFLYHMPLVWTFVFGLAVVLSLWTGKTLTKYQGIVSRQEAPFNYYFTVSAYSLLAIMFLWLHYFLASMHRI